MKTNNINEYGFALLDDLNGMKIAFNNTGRYNYQSVYGLRKVPKIKRVIFNNPATIILWDDNTKTIVKAENETFDPEKGLAMAITKKALGNEGNYYNELKKYLGDDYETKF